MADTRPWKLIAPWYRWGRQLSEEGREPRRTRPVFQKFDDPEFVKVFTKDPQRSLKFKDDIDRVFNVQLTVVPLGSSLFPNRFTRLYAPRVRSGQTRTASDAKLVPTGIRKLFLDTHKRYYLVVCELHCDAPGLPSATPDQVCQAAFIVRRRSWEYPGGARKEAAVQLKQIVAIQAEIADLDETSPAKGIVLQRRTQLIRKLKTEGAYAGRLADAKQRLADSRNALAAWKDAHGVLPIHEGWVAGNFKNIGSWQIVEETPQNVTESTFPLYPVFADPNLKNSATGKNIYFGVVPASSLDTDSQGNARFDDKSLYEIRCFVRRHKVGCPRKDVIPDCSGELFWSEPTESYMLAPPHDLMGTAQRPITINMPDLGELAAQAASLPLEKLAPAKMVQPQGLNFNVEDGKATGGSVGGGQICFFAIPLITIVAMFLLRLFLPIVVFLFGLYFLLQFRFCIPPSFQIDAGLKAQLDMIPPSVDVDVEFDASLHLPFTAAALNPELQAAVVADLGASAASDIGELNQFSNAALLPTAKIEAAAAANAIAGPDLTAGLEYEDRVEIPA
jgi:hypothetical protein